MKNLYMGIDGGGTSTSISLINELEEVVFMGKGDRSSVDTVTYDTSFENINFILKDFDFKDYKVTHIFAGVGGVVSTVHAHELKIRLRKLKGVDDQTIIDVKNDVYNALASGLIFDDGMTLIVGTGMAAFGQHHNQTHKSGGWGFKEGDAGSSYDLGFQAVKKAIRAADFRIDKTNFTKDVATTIGLMNATDIIAIMDDLHHNRTKVAALAPLVTKYANLGDEHAISIVDIATTELALCVKSIYETLKFKDVRLVIVGSLGNAEGVFKDMLYQKIKDISNLITIITPQIDPAYAAALLAKRI